jgi:lipopolysaccharide export system permease protein
MVTLELAKTTVSVLAVLVTIIVSRKFLGILTKAIEGEVAADTLFVLLGLKMLSALIVLTPPSLFLAMLMVFGRMYRDHEMTILSSSGVGLMRLYRAVLYFVLPLCVLSAYLALEVMPWSERQSQALMHRDEETADVRGIKPGRFNEFSRGDVVLYAEALEEGDNVLTDVFVQSRDGDKAGIVVAESGYLRRAESGEHFVVLQNGQRFQGVPGQADFILSEFEEYAVKIEDERGPAAAQKREAEPSMQLWRSSTPRELAELQKRIAVPLGALVLAILAIPLARVAPRGGVYGNVAAAFLIYLVYENLQKVSQGMLMTGKWPMWLSYSAVYVLMLVIVVYYLLRSYGVKWLVQSALGRPAR